MQLTEEQVAALLVKRLTNSITPEEQALLDQWVNASAANRQQYEELTDFRSLRRKMGVYQQLDEPAETFRMHAPMPAPAMRSMGNVRLLRWVLGIAAAFVLFLLVYFMTATKIRKPELVVVTPSSVNTIHPASGKAILTLGDGSHITLDSSNRSIQPGISQQGAQLVYGNTSSFSYNTLRTPRGGQFKVTLPDGTNVWLNAASSLKYPTAFNGKQRKVEVSGEAYFEVAQNAAQPFVVDIPGKTGIEVLGTHFNVNAYSDESSINTTLLEGKVRVGEKILQPGQEARVQNGVVQLVKANIEQAMAWRNGIFNFQDASLPAVMRQLSRWYDVDIVYEGKVPVSTFNGKIGRDLTLEDVVEGLKRAEVNCRIENGKLVVMP